MDDRTGRLVEALDPLGVALLLELSTGPALEADLLRAIGGATQPNANRKLDRLHRAGLLTREAGAAHAPGRLWSVVHPGETEALLAALFALSDAIDARDKERRDAATRKLKRARAARLGIRRAGDGN